ncbi:MAG: secretion protein HlyD [Polyangiaceae bacterium]|jgi:HlyD family secretion protein
MKPSRKAVALTLPIAVIAAAGAWLVLTGRIGRRTPPSNVLTLYGDIDIRQVELGFRVAGRLKTMVFEEGQSVTAGTLMAVLDSRPMEDELRLAQADVGVQDANVNKLVAGNRPPEIARARAAVEEAMAGQQNAALTLGRSQSLVASGALARAALDDAVAASQMADARLASAKDTYRLLLQGSRREDIAGGEASLVAAQARLAAAQTALDDTRLEAPSDGIVISRVREPGAIVSPNDDVYVLSLTHSVWVRAYVAEPQLGKVRDGMGVDIFSDSAPDHPFHGHVGFVSPTAEFTPKTVETPELRTELVYRLRIIVDDAHGELRQGMPVTVQIRTAGAT